MCCWAQQREMCVCVCCNSKHFCMQTVIQGKKCSSMKTVISCCCCCMYFLAFCVFLLCRLSTRWVVVAALKGNHQTIFDTISNSRKQDAICVCIFKSSVKSKSTNYIFAAICFALCGLIWIVSGHISGITSGLPIQAQSEFPICHYQHAKKKKCINSFFV